MVIRLAHVAVAVADLDAALEGLLKTWGLEVESRERVEEQGVEEATVPLGGSALQLITPIDGSSTVARFLERRGEGLHHLALEVDDLRATLADLRAKGVAVIDDQPRRGGGGHEVAFVHPRASLGVLIELVQRSASA